MTNQPTPQDWILTGQGLTRTTSWKDFSEALAYVVAVGKIAQELDHHPDIDIRWNQVTLTAITHSDGNITPADYHLAKELNSISEKEVGAAKKILRKVLG